jgi:ABC-type sugar transport system ATPase subunit
MLQRGDYAMTEPILKMEAISKEFPGVRALDNVHLEVMGGEILALLGENGAGKSTLMKILSGVYNKDSGRISLDGKEIEVHNPHQAQKMGITIIYQELNLMPNLSVAENIFIGREPNRFRFVDWRELHRKTRELTTRLGLNVSPTALVRNLSVAEQQMVEIARALSVESRVIIMDEPTSALTQNEVEHLFKIMHELRANGLGIIFISHRMDEVFEISDRIVVLRDGANVGTVDTASSSPDEIVRMMVGRPVSEFFGQAESNPGEVVLEARNISKTGSTNDPHKVVLRNVSMSVRAGEIVGMAGLVGSGRTDLARCIFGVDERDSGEILIHGVPTSIRSARDAIRVGMGMVPEDRKLQALFLAMSVESNASMAVLGDVAKLGFVSEKREGSLVEGFVEKLSVRLATIKQRVLDLSGGNQQKVVIARWLALKPRILIMDEPTRGIDVGAKVEVHTLMHALAREGVAIIMISSELPEVLAMSDRILVMHEGELVGELTRAEATQERIGKLMTG